MVCTALLLPKCLRDERVKYALHQSGPVKSPSPGAGAEAEAVLLEPAVSREAFSFYSL